MNHYTAVVLGIKILAYVAFVWAGWKGANRCETYFTDKHKGGPNKIDALLAPLVSKLLKGVVILLGGVAIAEILHLPVASLLTGLGIGGIAIAMAAKETIANIFGSITVLLDRPFQIGDWVKIGDIEGHVESMGFRSTRVRTFYDSVVTLPNATLLTAHVDNMGARKYRRVKTTLKLAYPTSGEKIQALRTQALILLEENPWVRKNGFDIALDDFGPQALHFSLQFFLEVENAEAEREEKHRIFLGILAIAHQLSLDLPNLQGT